jgi:hypothetical protein
MRRSALLAVSLLLTLTVPVAAQQYPADVIAGVRVRLAVRDSVRQEPFWPRQHMIIGTVTNVSSDTLYVAVPSTTGTLAVPRESVRQLSISRGVPSRAESALRTGLEWAVAGALSFWAAQQYDDDETFDSDGQAALIGAGVGFGVGGLIGAISPSERWRRVRLRN